MEEEFSHRHGEQVVLTGRDPILKADEAIADSPP
jgi:hypothetical protein